MDKIIEEAIKDIEKKFGKGAIMTFDSEVDQSVEFISTGILSLDMAIGGGFPKGRVVEIYGPESSGKTTLALQVLAEAQKQGVVAFIDVEHALDPVYARSLGIKVEDMLISQPDSAEEAMDILHRLVETGKVTAIVVDSVAALAPKAEIDGAMHEQHVGLQPRLMGKAMRKLNLVKGNNTCVIFINQVREKIGVFFGSPETTPGGKALKFAASVRLRISSIGQLKSGDEVIGARTQIKVKKNKVSAPFRQCDIDLLYDGKGISAVNDLFDLAIKYEILAKSGSWFESKIKDYEFRVQGRESALKHMTPEFMDVLRPLVEAEIKKALDNKK